MATLEERLRSSETACLVPTSGVRYFLEPDTVAPGTCIVRHQHEALSEGWLVFTNPASILQASNPDGVQAVLDGVEEATARGAYAVGFLSYEAGSGIDSSIETRRSEWGVLAWFGVYECAPEFVRELPPVYKDPNVVGRGSDMDNSEYVEAFAKVKDALREGESYQVNLTYRHQFETDVDAFSFFSSRCGVNPPPYAAFVHGGDWQVCSFSPELFLLRRGSKVETKPMKGTIERGSTPKEESRNRAILSNSPKVRAENLMIVDMVRNDLGRVANPGTVRVPELMAIETHRDILQMTSTVSAEVHATTGDLLKATFPPASVTGAPKVQTCRIISRLEKSPRHVYCGAVGFCAPNDVACFNVAIRTALFRDGQGEYGVGGGVVWDSVAEEEYAEAELKASILRTPADPWVLVESFAANASADLREKHRKRMAASAKELGVPFDEDAAGEAFQVVAPTGKVRVTLRADGCFETQVTKSRLREGVITARLASHAVRSTDPNLRHKTSSRRLTQALLEEAAPADEVLLHNERGEVTEFVWGNVVLELDGDLVTPPPDCGCLAGITVSDLACTGRLRYEVVKVEDLARATRIWLANAVVGLRLVSLEGVS